VVGWVMRHFGNQKAFEKFDAVVFREDAQLAHAAIFLDGDAVKGVRQGPLFLHRLCHRGHRCFLLSVSPCGAAAQCPMYFAYSVRALSTSLAPLMIARPSGNTVNS